MCTPGYHERRSHYWNGGFGKLVDASSPRTSTGGRYSQVVWGCEIIHIIAILSRGGIERTMNYSTSPSGKGDMKNRIVSFRAMRYRLFPLVLSCNHYYPCL